MYGSRQGGGGLVEADLLRRTSVAALWREGDPRGGAVVKGNGSSGRRSERGMTKRLQRDYEDGEIIKHPPTGIVVLCAGWRFGWLRVYLGSMGGWEEVGTDNCLGSRK